MRDDRRALALVGKLALSAALCVGVQCETAAAGDVKAGRAKAEKCAVCHGLDGMSKIPEAPNIAGQPENYLIAQLNAFKAGDRKNEMMSIVIGGLSAADVEDLAAYYSAIEITVGKVPGQ